VYQGHPIEVKVTGAKEPVRVSCSGSNL